MTPRDPAATPFCSRRRLRRVQLDLPQLGDRGRQCCELHDERAEMPPQPVRRGRWGMEPVDRRAPRHMGYHCGRGADSALGDILTRGHLLGVLTWSNHFRLLTLRW